MKKVLISAFTAYIAFSSLAGFAQEKKYDKKVSKEIIIRKNGNKDTKMKIEIDGDKVTINGKPLSDYKDDDVTVIEKDRMNKGFDNFLFTPDNNMDFEFFKRDSKDNSPHAFLGVVTEKSSDGAKINQVMKGSSAEKAGLKVGDVITKIDNKEISNSGELIESIRSYKPNDEVRVYYKRGGKKEDVKLKLGETKESNRTFMFNDNKELMNGNGYNFTMPPMTKMKGFKNQFFNWNMNNKVRLGVKVEDTQDNSGAKILSVEEGSAADKAGLKKDDIITEMNGEKVNDVNDIRERLSGDEDKETYTIKARRNNNEMNFEVKISKPVNSADL